MNRSTNVLLIEDDPNLGPATLELLAAQGRVEADIGLTGNDRATPLWKCPLCGGPMVLIERLSAVEARLRSPPSGVLCPDPIFLISRFLCTPQADG